MKAEKKNNTKKQAQQEPMSLSKERKLARKKEIAQKKREAVINKIVATVVIAALCIGIAAFAGYKIYRSVTRVKPSSNFSAMLEDNGFIKGVNASSYLNLAEYKNITIPAAEVEYTDEKMQEDIQKLLDEKKALNTSTDRAAEDGDKLNIDYVGTVDGVEFEGGNTDGKGADITIGAGTYVDDFEEQLIGHKIGDEVTVTVTFPADYKEESLQGKDAVFQVTVNGIYLTPEFDDAFVKENLSDYASTAEEYKEYLKTTNNKKNLENWIITYLDENTTVNSYPEDYIKQLAAMKKSEDQSAYEYINELYLQYNGAAAYKNFEDYVEMSEQEYDKGLDEKVQPQAKSDLIYQAILEKEGITVTEEEYLAYLTENGHTQEEYNESVAAYGKGYVMQQMVYLKALEIVKGTALVQ